MKLPEAELVKRILAGEKQLFAQLIEPYQKSIYNLAYRMVGNREDALDLTQETFLRAFRGLHTYNVDRPFAPWLYRIGTNLCIDHGKKRKLKTVSFILVDDNGEEMERSIADAGNEPGVQVVLKEEERELCKALLELPEKYRIPLILRHIHNYTYEEIGEVMEIPPGTVKTWIFRGRNQLKEYFRQHCDLKEGEGR